MNNLKFFQWLKKFDKPVLGICSGMHVISLIFNSKIKRKTNIGLNPISFTKNFLGYTGKKEVYELHNNYIIPSTDFQIYAKSKGTPQAIKHKGKKIYGVLFHPEVRNKELILNFVKEK